MKYLQILMCVLLLHSCSNEKVYMEDIPIVEQYCEDFPRSVFDDFENHTAKVINDIETLKLVTANIPSVMDALQDCDFDAYTTILLASLEDAEICTYDINLRYAKYEGTYHLSIDYVYDNSATRELYCRVCACVVPKHDDMAGNVKVTYGSYGK